MSELQELRELKIGIEKSEQFFIDLETLLAEHLDGGTPIEAIAFYMDMARLSLMNEVASQVYEQED